MDIYTLEDHCLNIEFEPIGNTDELSMYCCRLLKSDKNELHIKFSDRVLGISSSQIGIFLMTSMCAADNGKKLVISCTESLGRIFHMVGGEHLNLITREDIL